MSRPSFEELFERAYEAAGRKGSARAEHKKAEKEVLEAARALERSLEKESSQRASARMPHGSETFYSETTGSPGHPIEISLMTGSHGVADAKFSCFIERTPSGWSGSWYAYVPYGKSKLNAALKKECSGETSNKSRDKVIERITDAYGAALGRYGAELANVIEEHDEKPASDS